MICSMHTLPSYFLDYFDRVLLLAQGREVFFGSPSELRRFFFNSSLSESSHSDTLIFEIMRQCSFSVYDTLLLQRQQELDLSTLISKYEYSLSLVLLSSQIVFFMCSKPRVGSHRRQHFRVRIARQSHQTVRNRSSTIPLPSLLLCNVRSSIARIVVAPISHDSSTRMESALAVLYPA